MRNGFIMNVLGLLKTISDIIIYLPQLEIQNATLAGGVCIGMSCSFSLGKTL